MFYVCLTIFAAAIVAVDQWTKALAAAQLTDCVDVIIPGWLDRGGAINTISPLANTSANAAGMATSGYLVEVEKVTREEMDGWRRDYPEAFARKSDIACGVCLEGWLAEGEN